MRLDRLPVDAAVVGFLMTVIVVGFALAFWKTDEGVTSEEAATPTEAPTDGETTRPGELEIVMGDNFFDPDAITLPAGETVTINLVNEGSAIHNMRISGADGNYNNADDAVSDPDLVAGGETATIEWTVPDASGDEIPFRCDFHPTEMVGTITIE